MARIIPSASRPRVDEADELLAWWHEMMTTPVVALVDGAVDAERLRAYADFVSPAPS